MVAGAFVVLAVGLSLFQLFTAGVRPVGLFYQRGIHLALVEVLAFLLFAWPGRKGRGAARLRAWLLDGALMAAALTTALYLTVNLDAIVGRAGTPSGVDVVVGVVATLTLLEASRRALGWPIALIGLVSIVYAYVGPYLPGVLRHGGYGTGRIVGQLYLGQEGIYGIPLGVAATFVFIFILFGALLEVTGAGQFFMDLAYALTGRQAGGPAKAAVVASAALGSVSGSAIANVVTSGAFTIPLMKRVGYRPEEAGGIEAAASTGGQVLPPIMGAGAFLMAEYTGLPYLEIVRAALVPALLYIGTVFVFVHLVAMARGMQGLPAAELPRIGPTLARGWHYLVSLVVLVGALLMDLSVARVGFLSCLAVVALAAARAAWDLVANARRPPRGGRPGPTGHAWAREGVTRLVDGFVVAGRNTLPVSLACAVAGIIVGVVGLTGLGLKFSGLMLSLSQGSLFFALVLVMLASLVLGMGLPVTASYIVLIILAGPALVNEFGLPILIAHMVVFWFSQDSNVTPPVCLAAYAAAGVAGSDPMKTGLLAWKYAKGLYLIPLLMVVHPQIVLGGPLPLIIGTAVVAMVALAALAAALEGYALGPLRPPGRILLLAAAATVFHPSLLIGAVGAVVAVGFAVWNGGRRRV
ncbi:MAG TPA: TRAP transporter fused permease subunit [Longimicrobiales bacterium]|nr:TRAP transporter fused permease subunit [Longimicrobiales bacterium]